MDLTHVYILTIAIAAMTGYENHDAKKDTNTSTLTSPQPFNENQDGPQVRHIGGSR